MAELGAAFVSLAHLLGLLDKSGGPNWAFFGDPGTAVLGGLSGDREHLGKLQLALLGETGDADAFSRADSGLEWVPLVVEGSFNAGFVWNASEELRVGVGATVGVGDDVDLTLLARLATILDIKVGDKVTHELEHELGQLEFSAAFKVEDDFFLSGGALTATIDPDADPAFGFVLSVEAGSRSASLDFVASPSVPWDAGRLATFVLREWVRDAALSADASGAIKGIDAHLFAMLGDSSANGGSPIAPVPLLEPTGTAAPGSPFIANWLDSLLGADVTGAPGPLTFLWHARALLTGNNDPTFLDGSSYLKLVGPVTDTSATPPEFTTDGNIAEADDGAYIGFTGPDGAPDKLVLLLRPDPTPGANGDLIVPLVTRANGVVVRSAISGKTINALATSVPATDLGATQDGTSLVVPLTDNIAAPPLGTFALHVVLTPEMPAALAVVSGETVLLRTPESNETPEKIAAALLPWVLKALPDNGAGALTKAVGDLVADGLGSTEPTPDPRAMLRGLVILAAASAGSSAGSDVTLEVGDVFELKLGKDGTIEPKLTLGPIALGDIDLPIHVGRLGASASINLVDDKLPILTTFSIKIEDLRLTSPGGDGVAGSVFPDMREMDGFTVAFTWVAPGSVHIKGSGKIPIQRTIGPLQIVALLVEVSDTDLTVGVDLAFELAMIRVSVYELALTVAFEDGTPSLSLGGLGLSLDTGPIKLAGMFGQTSTGDYVGGAIVSVADLFELTAIGGYTQIPKDKNKPEGPKEGSLFIFASLVAPLGGPPYFFVTGIAGGFGYNRTLPPSGQLSDHPFLKVMSGELEIGGGSDAQMLETLSENFHPEQGSHWVAAGIQFTSLGFINGKLVVAIGFGHSFSLTLLGLAGFAINPIASFELAIESTIDEETVYVKAGLTKNSYVIDPDLLSLHGEFALQVWHTGVHAGDFVLSIGGYHKYLTKPDHYPEVERVGVKAVLWDFVRFSVECYFACTPQALMAGAQVSLSAEFAGIGAGLDVYIDVWIKWDPFYMEATLKIVVWFEFLGRHEISVELQIHTPPFGGRAVIDLAIVSFEVEFGSEPGQDDPPPLDRFLSRQLSLPATPNDTNGAMVARFSTADVAGLLRVDLTAGRAAAKPQDDSGAQEGIAAPIAVNAEFVFAVRTKLPIEATAHDDGGVTGLVDLPLCERSDLASRIDLGIAARDAAGAAVSAGKPKKVWWIDSFPVATFGATPVTEVQADELPALKAIALAPADATRPLTDQVTVDYSAGIFPNEDSAVVDAPEFEPPGSDEVLPLPLLTPDGTPAIGYAVRSTLFLGAVAGAGVAARPAKAGPRRDRTLDAINAYKPRPVKVYTVSGDLQPHRRDDARAQAQRCRDVPRHGHRRAGVAHPAARARRGRAAGHAGQGAEPDRREQARATGARPALDVGAAGTAQGPDRQLLKLGADPGGRRHEARHRRRPGRTGADCDATVAAGHPRDRARQRS